MLRVTSIPALLLVLLLVAGRGWALELKVATLAPDGTVWMTEMRRGAEEIERRTDGRVSFKFYPGGIMGNEKNVLRKIRVGQLHGAALTSLGLAQIYPRNQIYSLPLTFRSYDEVDYVRRNMDREILQGIEQNGYVTFGLAEGGFSYLMSKEPIRRLEDLKAQKVWIPEGDVIASSLMDAFGIAPIPLPLTDVLTGLQTGLLTTVGSTTSFAIALQWHTKVKYMTDVPIFYAYGAFVIDRRPFQRLSAADQAVVREVISAVFVKLDRLNRAANQSAKQALIKQGIEIIHPSAEDLAELRKVARKAREILAEKDIYSPGMLQTLDAHLAAYRNRHAKK